MAKGSGGSAWRTTGNERNLMIAYRAGGGAWRPEKAESARMLPDKIAGSRFFVHKSPDGGWAVSEYSTGGRIVGGDKTRAGAIASFRKRIAELRKGMNPRGMGFDYEWKDNIRRMIEGAGRMNRG